MIWGGGGVKGVETRGDGGERRANNPISDVFFFFFGGGWAEERELP